MPELNLILVIALIVLSLTLGMLFLMEVGRRIGVRWLAEESEGARAGAAVIEAAVFGLMSLLIAFTFYGAAARYDTRRELIVEEANYIGTAWLRLDLLPAAAQPLLRERFRQYVEVRLAVHRKLPDFTAAQAELAKSKDLQHEIWSQAVAACQASGSSSTTMLLLAALNQMIDITTTRIMGVQMHPPPLIYAMLALMVLAGSLIAGYNMAASKRRDWFHLIIFVVVMGVAIYVILDFEFPRLGLIRIQSFDQVLVDLRQSME